MKERKRKVKAWLVTWEWVGDHAAREKKVAAVLSPRYSGEHVRELVEFLYMAEYYTAGEQIEVMREPKSKPYPAEFVRLDGVPWEGQIHCGHNPHLFARLVDDLTVEEDSNRNETPVWKERPRRKVDAGLAFVIVVVFLLLF